MRNGCGSHKASVLVHENSVTSQEFTTKADTPKVESRKNSINSGRVCAEYVIITGEGTHSTDESLLTSNLVHKVDLINVYKPLKNKCP